MFRHVTLIEAESNGRQSYRLLGPDGHFIPAFDVFAKTLEHSPFNTRKNYLSWLAGFFDFLFEASMVLGEDDTHPNQETLVAVIEAYDDYLVLGEDSGNSIAQRVSQTMPSPRVSRGTSATKHAAIRSFLRLSELVRKQMLDMAAAGLQIADASEHPLIPALGEQRPLTFYEKHAMKANSMLAGCISMGPQLIKQAILPTSTPDVTYEHGRAFPFDRVGDTLDQMTTWRDKALYAGAAASGGRISELLQMLWDDVDAATQQIRLIDPNARPHSPSYLALRPIERDRLVWKGRATSLTLLIEPFASMFFEALAAYLRHEYIPHGRHKFIFQYTNQGEAGRPYFLASAASRNEVLRRAMTRAGVDGIAGPHSFRHMYGTFLVNYFPRPDGTHGLPLAIVQKLMGHKQLKNTAKYAQHDRDLLDAELRYANAMIFQNGQPKSINEFKRDALLARLRQVERDLLAESTQSDMTK